MPKTKYQPSTDLLRLFAKTHAFQNLMYLAIISVLNQPVVHSRYMQLSLPNRDHRYHKFFCPFKIPALLEKRQLLKNTGNLLFRVVINKVGDCGNNFFFNTIKSMGRE